MTTAQGQPSEALLVTASTFPFALAKQSFVLLFAQLASRTIMVATSGTDRPPTPSTCWAPTVLKSLEVKQEAAT